MKSTIAFVNESTVVKDSDVLAAVQALQVQVTRDLRPIWGMDANLIFSAKSSVPHGAWVVAILDDSDQAGALGYHDVTLAGLPLAKIFAKSDIENGFSWTVTASHELIEMLGDPETNETVFVQTGQAKGTIYARELCDAPEADQYGYEIDGVRVSDFVLPSWFDPAIAHAKRDFMGHIARAFELLPGGYIGVFPVPNNGEGWTQKVAEVQGNPGMRTPGLPEHSRRAKRLKKLSGLIIRSTAV